jgi:hypothetical protein
LKVVPLMPASSSSAQTLFRRGAGCCLLAATMAWPFAALSQPTAKTLAMMNFELVDDTVDKSNNQAQQARLAMISQQLRMAFIENQIYTVMDNTPATEMIADLTNRFALHDCNGCDVEIGRALNADRVMTGWVQKVSNLILNINIQIRDVKSGLIMLNKSVDIRGNTDDSWSRGIRYMVRSIKEKNQANR